MLNTKLYYLCGLYVRRVLKGNNGDDDQRRGYGAGAAYNSTRLYTVRVGRFSPGSLPFSPAHKHKHRPTAWTLQDLCLRLFIDRFREPLP